MRYTQDRFRIEARENILQLIFLAMESLKLSYSDIMMMPVGTLYYLLEEKNKFSEEIAKQLEGNRQVTLPTRR